MDKTYTKDEVNTFMMFLSDLCKEHKIFIEARPYTDETGDTYGALLLVAEDGTDLTYVSECGRGNYEPLWKME